MKKSEFKLTTANLKKKTKTKTNKQNNEQNHVSISLKWILNNFV